MTTPVVAKPAAGLDPPTTGMIVRSIAFNLVFYLWTTVLAFAAIPLLFGTRRQMVAHAERWERSVQWLLRTIVKLDFEVRGQDQVGMQRCIYAFKHQSAWDTITAHLVVKDPAIALKRELTLVPIFGWCLLKAGMIKIDRGHGTRALRSLIEGGKAALLRGSPIVIFPEGTRALPGENRPYQPGVAALYKYLDVHVVPVALNSGMFWGRRSFVKRPGKIVVEFLRPIEPGMDRKSFMAELEHRIESAAERLMIEARATAENVAPSPNLGH